MPKMKPKLTIWYKPAVRPEPRTPRAIPREEEERIGYERLKKFWRDDDLPHHMTLKSLARRFVDNPSKRMREKREWLLKEIKEIDRARGKPIIEEVSSGPGRSHSINRKR